GSAGSGVAGTAAIGASAGTTPGPAAGARASAGAGPCESARSAYSPPAPHRHQVPARQQGEAVEAQAPLAADTLPHRAVRLEDGQLREAVPDGLQPVELGLARDDELEDVDVLVRQHAARLPLLA